MQTIFRAACIALIAGLADVAAADTLRAVDKAPDAVRALAIAAYNTGQPPRQSDPRIKLLLDTGFDTGRFNGPTPVPFSDITQLSERMAHAFVVGSVYIFAGTAIPAARIVVSLYLVGGQAVVVSMGVINQSASSFPVGSIDIHDFAHVPNIDDKQQRQVITNLLAYSPEIGRYLNTIMELQHASIDSIDAELETHPEKYQAEWEQTGLTAIRGGVMHTLSSVMMTFLTPGLEVGWMRARLPPLLAIAPSDAKFLPAEGRRNLAEIARNVAARVQDSEVRRGLEGFARTVGP